MAENKAVYYGTGRRKTSVARVRLVPGTGLMTVQPGATFALLGRNGQGIPMDQFLQSFFFGLAQFQE